MDLVIAAPAGWNPYVLPATLPTTHSRLGVERHLVPAVETERGLERRFLIWGAMIYYVDTFVFLPQLLTTRGFHHLAAITERRTCHLRLCS